VQNYDRFLHLMKTVTKSSLLMLAAQKSGPVWRHTPRC